MRPVFSLESRLFPLSSNRRCRTVEYVEPYNARRTGLSSPCDYYRDANVIMVGGLLEYPTYAGVYDPEGFIDALENVIARADADTKIIPWKGPVVSRVELQEWRDVIETMAANVSALIAEGRTVDEIVAARPSAGFDDKWGGGRTPDRFAQDMHYVLTQARGTGPR